MWPVRFSKTQALFSLCLIAGVFWVGCASAPLPGPTGPNAGADVPGMVVNILDVNEGETVEVGQAISVRFTLKTSDGHQVQTDELDHFLIYVSGPSNNYQRVILPQGDIEGCITTEADGSYTYRFAKPFPRFYAPPPNDSPTFAAVDNELTGTPIGGGTYTVGIEAGRSITIGGQTVREAGDATLDFSVGDAPLIRRQVVIQANCEKCHSSLTAHNASRFSLTGCLLCHISGGEDLISDDPALATPGVSIQMANMIHRLHRGADSPLMRATRNSNDPFKYELIGAGEMAHDFSDVKFPVMPGGTGFDEQTRNCEACHGAAEQGGQAFTSPSRAACGGCHDDIDWTAGTMLDPSNPEVVAGTLTRAQLSDPAFRVAPGSIPHQFNDGPCTQCHNSGTPSLDPAVVHTPPLADPENIIGLKCQILSVTGQSGAGFFQVGDFPVVSFQLLDRNDNSVDMTAVASVRLVLAGPVENNQRVFPVVGTSAVLVKGVGGVPNSGTGPFAYTSDVPIPATYPAALNAVGAFNFADGWGTLNGQPLLDGNYTVMLYAYRQFEWPADSGVFYREAAEPALAQIRIGSSGPTPGYPGHVTDAKCNLCHSDLRYHGNTRKGVQGCVLCHTGGSEDRPTPSSGTQSPQVDTLDFKVMIHKIHAGRQLDVVQDCGAYDLVGFNNALLDFSGDVFPAMPHGAADCTACHATDSWKAPIERNDVDIWKVACSSCHDSASTLSHIQLNTQDNPTPGQPGIETCATCHGAGTAYSVEQEHL